VGLRGLWSFIIGFACGAEDIHENAAHRSGVANWEKPEACVGGKVMRAKAIETGESKANGAGRAPPGVPQHTWGQWLHTIRQWEYGGAPEGGNSSKTT